jgi:hypothetical protein
MQYTNGSGGAMRYSVTSPETHIPVRYFRLIPKSTEKPAGATFLVGIIERWTDGSTV